MTRIPVSFIIVTTCSLFYSFSPIQAAHTNPQTLLNLTQHTEIALPPSQTLGGYSLASADLGTDGTQEFILGNGLGAEPRVTLLRQDGSEIAHFLAYAPTLGVGIHVIACDLTGDGLKEIITSPQRGGGPHIRVFDRFGSPMGTGMFAYSESFRGGVNLACGQLAGDDRAELVTLPGAEGGPHVRVWNFNEDQFTLQQEWFAFDATDVSGLIGTISDKQLIIAQQHTSSPIIKTYSLTNDITLTETKQFLIEATGLSSIVIHNQQRYLSTASNGLLYNIETNEQEKISDVQESFTLVSTDDNTTVHSQLLAAPSRVAFEKDEVTQIVVDLSDQVLSAYQQGILENSFLISSGKNNATPLGNHHILAKIPKVHYAWTYGPNDPRNYDLGLVPYNLRFAPHLYVHYAYWHNNFGHPMSRGCVNVSLSDMKWLYDWTEVGTPISIVQ